MNWLRSWLRTQQRSRYAPAHSHPAASVSLALEKLEDRTLPSTSPASAAYNVWRHQVFHVDDVTIAQKQLAGSSVSTKSVNGNFGNQIGLNTVLAGSPYRG